MSDKQIYLWLNWEDLVQVPSVSIETTNKENCSSSYELHTLSLYCLICCWNKLFNLGIEWDTKSFFY